MFSSFFQSLGTVFLMLRCQIKRLVTLVRKSTCRSLHFVIGSVSIRKLTVGDLRVAARLKQEVVCR
jgi:hypothetical protein